MKDKLNLFLKGILMGICDLVPGISGGTIAFITGIYERLICAISNFNFKNKINFIKSYFNNNINKGKKIRSEILKKLDLGFLGILFLGIATSIILGSHIISYLLENYFIYLMSFFVGLILVSTKIIYKTIDNHNAKNISFAILGFFFGFALLFLSPKEILNPSYFYIFLGGFLAVSALFLPGISGSFVLLVLGLYEFIINSVKDLFVNFKTLTMFLIGAVLGAFFISNLVSYLFKKDKSLTLYVLLGIVLGSLIIPIMRIIQDINEINYIIIFGLIISIFLGSISGHSIEKFVQIK